MKRMIFSKKKINHTLALFLCGLIVASFVAYLVTTNSQSNSVSTDLVTSNVITTVAIPPTTSFRASHSLHRSRRLDEVTTDSSEDSVSPDPDEDNHVSGIFMDGEYHGPTLRQIICFHLDMPIHSQHDQISNNYHHHCIAFLYK